MANVLIRDLPDDVVKELKQRAKSHNRPLQQELRTILVETARQPYADIAQRAVEIKSKLAKKGVAFTDSTELLQEDRSR